MASQEDDDIITLKGVNGKPFRIRRQTAKLAHSMRLYGNHTLHLGGLSAVPKLAMYGGLLVVGLDFEGERIVDGDGSIFVNLGHEPSPSHALQLWSATTSFVASSHLCPVALVRPLLHAQQHVQAFIKAPAAVDGN